MEATSTQNIKNVKDISISIDDYPVERKGKITIVATTDDDIFEFVFEGDHILQSCKAAGLFTGWEKDQKIRELEKENISLNYKCDGLTWANDNMYKAFCRHLEKKRKLAEENKKLKEELNSLKQLKTDLPETPFTDAMLIDGYNKLTKENEKLEKENRRLNHKCDSLTRTNDNMYETFCRLLTKKQELAKENKKLKEEVNSWKKEAAEYKETVDYWSKAYYDLSKNYDKLMNVNKQLKEEYEEKLDDLQHKYDLERGANEAQHKFFREYAGNDVVVDFNYAIGDDEEVTYAIVDKEEYKSLKKSLENLKGLNDKYSVFIHGMSYNPVELMDMVSELETSNKQLRDRVKELEELKTPTIENFKDEKPSSRRDVLKAAEKCVCGKREQDYGTPESNFQLIADLWNGYLGFTDPGDKVKPTDVAMMMALMKIARIRNGGGSGDSFVDLAGYAACGGEIWAEAQKQKDQK